MNNKNYRVMKFFEQINKKDRSRGYVRLDIRGIRGNIIVSVENLGDAKTSSEVYLYKDRDNKIKLGEINNKKGMLKKLLTFGNNNAIEDYNVCAVVKDKKISMYTNLFNATSVEHIKKLELDEDDIVIEGDTVEESKSISEKADEDKLSNKTANEKVEVPDVANKTDDRKKQNELAEKQKTEETKEIIEKPDKFDEEQSKIEEASHKTEETKEIIEKSDKVDGEQSKIEEASRKKDNMKKTTVNSAINIDENSKKEKDIPAEAQSRKYRNKFDESLYNILKEYKQVEPLSVKIKSFYWWYIPYDESGIKNGFLPYYNQIVSSYYPYPMSNRVTTCSSLMKKYGHYIFGVYKEKGDVIKFVYGIPGEFSKEEQPYKGVTGFKNWSYSNKDNYDKHGYWLAFVNPKTGETTEPPEIALS